jgi:uncharacterized membrane protein
VESPRREDKGKLGLERLIFFSDAVFAIAITLLVLDIQLPGNPNDADIPGALAKVAPQIGGYVLSFFVIGAYWIAHHRFYRHIVRYDHALLWLNLFLLLFIAFIPFPTRVVSNYGNVREAVILYAATIALTGIVMAVNWWYAVSGHRLIEPDLDPAFIRWVYFLDTPPAEARRFSVLRRSLRHGSPKALPKPLYILGGVVVPMQACSAVRAGVPTDGQAFRDDHAAARTRLTRVGRIDGDD